MTLKSDVRLARKYGPIVVKSLASNIADLAQSKVARRPRSARRAAD
jgi:hypothetical protein